MLNLVPEELVNTNNSHLVTFHFSTLILNRLCWRSVQGYPPTILRLMLRGQQATLGILITSFNNARTGEMTLNITQNVFDCNKGGAENL